MEHILKVTKKKFEPLLNGDLTFVIRRADRLYSVGDRLILFEVDGANETGRSLVVLIKFIAHSEDTEGIKDDYCVFSVKRSAKNSRTNAGNHPQSEAEAIEYAATIGKSADCAKRFYNYYAMTGWKMKSGLPLSDWHAALRNWKDFQSNQNTPEQAEENKQLELLLPLLCKKTVEIAKKYKVLSFNDPHIATVIQFGNCTDKVVFGCGPRFGVMDNILALRAKIVGKFCRLVASADIKKRIVIGNQ